jgi:hypothetical protein
MQSLGGVGAGVAVCCAGVTAVGGACALAPDAVIKTHERKSAFFLRMRENGPAGLRFQQ